jgi:hypothetical protein
MDAESIMGHLAKAAVVVSAVVAVLREVRERRRRGRGDEP